MPLTLRSVLTMVAVLPGSPLVVPEPAIGVSPGVRPLSEAVPGVIHHGSRDA